MLLTGEIAKTEIDLVQFRFDEIDYADNFTIFQESVAMLKKAQKGTIINDRFEIALSLGADGVHLGLEDVPVELVRKIGGQNLVIGQTVRNVTQGLQAKKSGADYIAVGPCFETPTKPGLKSIPPGVVKEIAKASDIPVFAVGGINGHTAKDVVFLGARRLAAARYLTTGNVFSRARNLRSLLKSENK